MDEEQNNLHCLDAAIIRIIAALGADLGDCECDSKQC